jgi:hypothetical protein
VLGMGEGV